MEETATLTRAYDLLNQIERDVVDEYVEFCVREQRAKRQRIAVALSNAIPSEHVRRSRGLLSKPIVRIAIAEKLRTLADEEDLSPSRVIKEHAGIAFSSIKDFMFMTDLGDLRFKSIADIPDEVARAIKTIKSVPTAYGDRVEVVMHDKQVSLKALGEMMGLVASDATPALKDYVTPIEEKEAALTQEPADYYQTMLENANA